MDTLCLLLALVLDKLRLSIYQLLASQFGTMQLLGTDLSIPHA